MLSSQSNLTVVDRMISRATPASMLSTWIQNDIDKQIHRCAKNDQNPTHEGGVKKERRRRRDIQFTLLSLRQT
jgi:hypothetical protein